MCGSDPALTDEQNCLRRYGMGICAWGTAVRRASLQGVLEWHVVAHRNFAIAIHAPYDFKKYFLNEYNMYSRVSVHTANRHKHARQGAQCVHAASTGRLGVGLQVCTHGFQLYSLLLYDSACNCMIRLAIVQGARGCTASSQGLVVLGLAGDVAGSYLGLIVSFPPFAPACLFIPSGVPPQYLLLILQGNTLPPFEYYKGIPSFASNITRQYPPSLLILQGNTLQVRTAPARVSCAERGTLLRRTSILLSSVCAHAQAMVLALLSGGLVSCCMNTTNAECRSTASMVLCVLVSRRAAIADNCSCTCKCGVTGFGAGIRE